MRCFKPHLDVLPPAQRQIWPHLKAFADRSLVLYGGTAVALYFGHRASVYFDFFTAEPLDKSALRAAAGEASRVSVLLDGQDTLAVSVVTSFGPVKLSFFGRLNIGRVDDPLQTADRTLLVASPNDLMATKLKAILDRAEARDYRDIAALLRRGISVTAGLAAFRTMFKGEPMTVLRALCFYEDGNLPSLDAVDRDLLSAAAARIGNLPAVKIRAGSLAVPMADCDELVEFPLGGSSLGVAPG
ncbi:MAG TPA: nucleotidyl transferase AbiEii/AbiGii toxin family protein [Xanthobacteraceae bacterium]|jgi:hypothetical protein|nr:nucleotidyl transferase AbiEii/AbiGii toxin family protein [Xanthobacteraceae bacterium]